MLECTSIKKRYKTTKQITGKVVRNSSFEYFLCTCILFVCTFIMGLSVFTMNIWDTGNSVLFLMLFEFVMQELMVIKYHVNLYMNSIQVH